MKKGLLAVSFVATGLMSGVAMADLHVGVVHVEKVFSQSPVVQAQKAKLQADFKAKQARVQAAQKQLQDLMGKYQRDKTVMSDKQKKAMEAQLNTQQSSLIQMEQTFSQQANQAQDQAMQTFLGKLQTAAQKVAVDKHLDLVLPDTGVIFSTDALDITNDVMKDMQ